MSQTSTAEERWAIAVTNGLRPADVEAWMAALIEPRRCRHCRVTLPPMPGPGRDWGGHGPR